MRFWLNWSRKWGSLISVTFQYFTFCFNMAWYFTLLFKLLQGWEINLIFIPRIEEFQTCHSHYSNCLKSLRTLEISNFCKTEQIFKVWENCNLRTQRDSAFRREMGLRSASLSHQCWSCSTSQGWYPPVEWTCVKTIFTNVEHFLRCLSVILVSTVH